MPRIYVNNSPYAGQGFAEKNAEGLEFFIKEYDYA